MSSSTRWRYSVQQRCGFRKAARKPESRKVEEELGHVHSESSEAPPPRRSPPTPQWEQQAPPSSPRSFGRLFRPLVFTIGVSSGPHMAPFCRDVTKGADANASSQAAPSARPPSFSTSRSSRGSRATLTRSKPIGWRGCGRRSEETPADR